MSKKIIKYFFELVYIFILPLVFICATSQIEVEREFTYDNEGNYQVSEDTKKLSFDNSIIKYTKQKTIYIDVLTSSTNLLNLDGTKTLYLKLSDLTLSVNDNGNNYRWFDYGLALSASIQQFNNYRLYIFKGFSSISFEPVIVEIDNETYYSYENVNLTLYENEINSNNATFINNYYTYDQQEDEITVNTVWGNIKYAFESGLDLNEDSLVLDLVFCYIILWFIMFLSWHIIYLLFDKLFHLRKE